MGTKGSVGQRIRELRTSLGVTQERLAEAADLSRDGLVRIERGDRNPSFTSIASIASALGVPIEQLWHPTARPVPSHETLRVRRVEIALSRVPPAFAEAIVESVERVCSEASRLQSRPRVREPVAFAERRRRRS
jgi:transcriptional regulator with XRE-family HTH domain